MLFLKLTDEYSKPHYNRDTHIPKDLNRQSPVNDNLLGATLEKQ